MIRIGILGGCFDPIHYGHLIMAETAIEAAGLDEVILVPTYSPPHGKPIQAEYEHRVRMTKLAVQDRDEELVTVSDVEMHISTPSYTVKTLNTIRQKLDIRELEYELFLVIGGDEYMQFSSWVQPKKIVEQAGLLVITRDGYPPKGTMDPAYPPVAVIDKVSPLEIKSTDMRNAIAEGRSIRYLTPDPVRAYIDEHRLYRKRIV